MDPVVGCVARYICGCVHWEEVLGHRWQQHGGGSGVECHTLHEEGVVGRAEFVIGSNIEAIWWQGDAIMFDGGTTKTDQEGVCNIYHPWHIYSNHEDPFICPLLALACYLIDHFNILAGKCPLFEGSGQYDQYSKILFDIVSSIEHRDLFV